MKNTIFLFPGDGIHQKDMLTTLYNADDFFRDFFDKNIPALSGIYEIDLMDEEKEDSVVNQMRIVFSEVAIASYWKEKGVNPYAVIGHSLGEYGAACFSGVFSLEVCLGLIRKRGEVLRNTHGVFRMGVVHAGQEEVTELLKETGKKVEISAVNSKQLVTVSGFENEVRDFLDICSGKGINANLTPIQGGGHNSFLKNYVSGFAEDIENEKFSSPDIRMISTAFPEEEQNVVTSGRYWVDQMLNKVNLMGAFETEEAQKAECMIDVGVSPSLLGMAIEAFRHKDMVFIPSIRAGRNYKKQLSNALDLINKNSII